MSADMRARQFTRFERAWRLTPRIFAPSVTLRPSGYRQDTRTILPGCGGFFMGMSVLFLSVVIMNARG